MGLQVRHRLGEGLQEGPPGPRLRQEGRLAGHARLQSGIGGVERPGPFVRADQLHRQPQCLPAVQDQRLGHPADPRLRAGRDPAGSAPAEPSPGGQDERRQDRDPGQPGRARPVAGHPPPGHGFRLEQVAGQLRHGRALSLHQGHVTGDVQVLEVFRQVGESVGGGVHVGVVDLVGVAREHDLGAVPRPGEDRLHLMRGQVLGLVDDDVLVRDAPSADVGQGLDAEVAPLLQLGRSHGGAAPHLHVGGHDEVQVVVDGLHVGPELLLHVPGEEAEVTPHGHHGPAHQELVVALVVDHLLQAGGDGQQGLARARLAQEGDHHDRVVQQEVQGELLLAVPGFDTPGRRLHAAQGQHLALPAVVAAQGRVRLVGAVHQRHELVGMERPVLGGHQPAVVEQVQGLGIHVPLGGAGVELVQLHLVRGVVLGQQADGIGLDAQVRVLGDQDHLLLARFEQLPGAGQDLVVRLVLVQGEEADLVLVAGDVHLQGSAPVHHHAVAEAAPGPELVHLARDAPGVPPDFRLVLLEVVHLLDHDDRNHDVVLLEMEDRLGIVEQYVGVEHEHLLAGCDHRCLLRLPAFGSSQEA